MKNTFLLMNGMRIKVKAWETRFMDCVEKKLQQISKHPEYYSKRKADFRVAKIKDFPYVIVYQFFSNKSLIHIASIYHEKRNQKGRYRKMSK